MRLHQCLLVLIPGLLAGCCQSDALTSEASRDEGAGPLPAAMSRDVIALRQGIRKLAESVQAATRESGAMQVELDRLKKLGGEYAKVAAALEPKLYSFAVKYGAVRDRTTRVCMEAGIDGLKYGLGGAVPLAPPSGRGPRPPASASDAPY